MKRNYIKTIFILLLCIALTSCGDSRNETDSDMEKNSDKTSTDSVYKEENTSIIDSTPKPDSVGLEMRLNKYDDTWAVAGIGSCTDTEIVIPATYEGKPVTAIDNKAFRDCNLTSIVIPDSVLSIGSDAFKNCSRLTNIVLSNNITRITHNMFCDCDNLRSIVIPNGVTIIDYNAFNSCDSLSSISIPDSVTSIGAEVFNDCHNLSSVSIPDSVTSIGAEVFNNTRYYNTTSNWENGVLYIGNHLIAADASKIPSNYEIKAGTLTIAGSAFEDCENLKNIVIPKSIISIGSSAFSNCKSLTSISIPNNVTEIGSTAFSDCVNLTNIVIPEGVTNIGSQVFMDCEELTNVTFPKSLTSMGHEIFTRCNSLNRVEYNGTKAEWEAIWLSESVKHTVYCTDGEIGK